MCLLKKGRIPTKRVRGDRRPQKKRRAVENQRQENPKNPPGPRDSVFCYELTEGLAGFSIKKNELPQGMANATQKHNKGPTIPSTMSFFRPNV